MKEALLAAWFGVILFALWVWLIWFLASLSATFQFMYRHEQAFFFGATAVLMVSYQVVLALFR
jgi:hypothetical protein